MNGELTSELDDRHTAYLPNQDLRTVGTGTVTFCYFPTFTFSSNGRDQFSSCSTPDVICYLYVDTTCTPNTRLPLRATRTVTSYGQNK